MVFDHEKHNNIINKLKPKIKKFYNTIKNYDLVKSDDIITFFDLVKYEFDGSDVDVQSITEMIMNECSSINNDFQWDWIFHNGEGSNILDYPDFKIIWFEK